MEPVREPISASRVAGLAIVVALAAAVAIVGLALSDQGDDAERAAYLASLMVAGATGLLLVALAQRRRAEIAALRAEAAVVVFRLRVRAGEVAQSASLPRDRLAEALRAATQLTFKGRALVETLIQAGVEQEAIELRVAIEAVELALRPGPTPAGG